MHSIASVARLTNQRRANCQRGNYKSVEISPTHVGRRSISDSTYFLRTLQVQVKPYAPAIVDLESKSSPSLNLCRHWRSVLGFTMHYSIALVRPMDERPEIVDTGAETPESDVMVA